MQGILGGFGFHPPASTVVRETEKQNPFPRPLSVILITIVMAEDKNAAARRILRAFRAK